jgi:hypothetical protein
MDNGEYATTGGQKTPTCRGADLAAAAHAMGLPDAVTVRTGEELAAALAQRPLQGRGPSVIVAKVDESTPTARPALDCVYLKQRFMTAIGVSEAATSGSSR